MRFSPTPKSWPTMSPGVGGARLTQPLLGPLQVKVFTKNDSPPTMRFRPPSSPPPPMPVVISTSCWATMAPGSAFTVSPLESSSVSMV